MIDYVRPLAMHNASKGDGGSMHAVTDTRVRAPLTPTVPLGAVPLDRRVASLPTCRDATDR